MSKTRPPPIWMMESASPWISSTLTGSRRHASRGVLPPRPRDADDGGDPRREIAREPLRHEAPVGVPDDVDAPRVDGHAGDVVDQGGHVGDVVDALAVEVAARVGGVPEAVALGVERAIGIREHETLLVRQRQQTEGPGVMLAGGAVAVQHDDERGGAGAVPRPRHVLAERALARRWDRRDGRPGVGRRRALAAPAARGREERETEQQSALAHGRQGRRPARRRRAPGLARARQPWP